MCNIQHYGSLQRLQVFKHWPIEAKERLTDQLHNNLYLLNLLLVA